MLLVVLNLSISFIYPLQWSSKVILPIAQLAKYRIKLFQVFSVPETPFAPFFLFLQNPIPALVAQSNSIPIKIFEIFSS